MINKLYNYIDSIFSKGLGKDIWFMTKQTMSDFYMPFFVAEIVEKYNTQKYKNESFASFYSRAFREDQYTLLKFPKQSESENTYRNAIISEFFGLFHREKNSYDSATVTPAYITLKKYIKDHNDIEKFRFLVDRQIEKLCLNINVNTRIYDDVKEVTIFPIIYLYKILIELYKKYGSSKLNYDEFLLFLVYSKQYSQWQETIELIDIYRNTRISENYKNKINDIIYDSSMLNIRFDALFGSLSNIDYVITSNEKFYQIKENDKSILYIQNVVDIFEHSDYIDCLDKSKLREFMESERYFIGYLDVFNTVYVNIDKNDSHKDYTNNKSYNNFKVFGMHITKENNALDESDPHICIGWSTLGDLSTIKSIEDLKKHYSNIWPNFSNSRRGQDVSQLWLFLNDMQIGDYVVFFSKGYAHFGKIISDYQYVVNPLDQDGDYVHNRRVQWIKHLLNKDLPVEYRKSAISKRSVYRLDTFKPLIDDILNNKNIESNEDDEDTYLESEKEYFDFKISPIKEGQNLIVYGAPGCGKSYYVEHELTKDYKEDNKIRTTFYQDYTNTDFVGQILPVVDGDKVTYNFTPGPFALALKQAIENPNEKVALIIEELNRGSAASIFGDIFQLLDRDNNGVSVYPIKNINIINYLNKEFDESYQFKDIKIPGNLSIFATMNTSDQNVFTLDTAFKRRWNFKKLTNEFDSNHKFKDYYIPGDANNKYTWKELVEIINDYLLNMQDGFNSEDKQIGVYFLDASVMRKDASIISSNEDIEKFAYKFFEYLWDDVAKFHREEWFDSSIKSLDQLVEKYKKEGLKVFNENVIHNKE